MVVQNKLLGHLTDPLNLKNQRNIRNTDKFLYNCGGYALGTFSWYMPCEIAGRDAFYFDDDEEAEDKTAKCVDRMLHEIPGLRAVNSPDEVLPNEYLIAFRLSDDGDFHFIKRDKNNHWHHKRGQCEYIDTMTAEEVFSDCWFPNYCGPLVLLAKRG